MPDVGVLELQIQDNSQQAGDGLDALARALRAVKEAKKNFDLSKVGQQVTQLAKTIQETKGASTIIKNLGTMFNAINKFSQLKDFTIDTEKLRETALYMNKVADAQDRLKENASTGAGDWRMAGGTGGTQNGGRILPFDLQFFARRSGLGPKGEETLAKAESLMEQINKPFEQLQMDLEGLMRPVESTTQTIEGDMQAFASAINGMPLDFSKFDPSNLPLNVLAMTTEEFRNGAVEVQKYGDAVRDTDKIVSGMKADFTLDTFNANQSTGLIVYNENLENSWERICERTAEAKREFDEYVEGQKKAIFGNESIKPLWENPMIGPTLQGMFGSEQQWAMIEKISSTTGLNTENIVEQLYNLTNGLVDLRHAEEETAQSGAAEEVVHTIEEIGNYSGDTMSKIELLQNKIAHLWSRVAQLSELPKVDELGRDNGNTNAINNYLLQIGRTNEQLQKLIEKSHEAQNAMQFNALKSGADNLQRDYGGEMVDNMVNNYSEIDLLTLKMNGMKQALADDINQNKVDTQQIAERTMAIQNLSAKIEELKDKQEETTSSTISLRGAWDELKNGVKRMFPTLTSLIKRFKSMAVMRAMRYAIREVSKAFSEGIQNVYKYSEAIGSSFSASMDSAATSLLQMKNSIGAALAPAIQALIPILQTVINWFITGINYVNQFFALLNGQATWTRALPKTTKAFEDQKKAAKGAGAAIKDLLADWDELNIIQSESGGGGSGGASKAAEDYLNMFEEVGKFENKIKGIVEWIQDHMDLIKRIATAIGAGILAWKLSNALLGGLESLNSLVHTGIAIAVGLQLTWEGAYSAGLSGGFDSGTLLTTAAGIITTTVSSALLGYKLAGPWGAVIGGAAGLIASIAVAVTAYFDGERTKQMRDKWGKLKLTQEEIDELVEGQVTTKISVGLEVADASIQRRAAARLKVNSEIYKFSTSFDTAKFALEAKSGDEAIQDALATASAAIAAIQEKLDADKEGLKLSFTKFTYKDAEGNNITTELYKNLSDGTTALSKFFTDIGNDIAKYISKGYSEGLTEQEQIMAMDLMTTFDNIVNGAKKRYEINKIIREAQDEMSGMYDMDTAQGILEKQQQRLDDYKNTTTEQMKQDRESLYENLEYYKGIQDYYKEKGNADKVAEYEDYITGAQTAIDNLEESLEKIKKGTYDWHLDEDYAGMVERMKEMWRDKFKEFYSKDYFESLFDNGKESPFSGLATEGINAMFGYIGQSTHDLVPGWLKEFLGRGSGSSILPADILSFFGFNPSSLLSDEEIEKYYDYAFEKSKGNYDAMVSEVESKIGSVSDALMSKYTFTENEGQQIFDNEKFSQIQEAIGNLLLTGIVEGSDHWNSEMAHIKRNFGSENVDEVYSNIFEGLKTAYDGMIDDMFKGMDAADLINKYSNYKWFADMFVEKFGIGNGKAAPGYGMVASNGMTSFARPGVGVAKYNPGVMQTTGAQTGQASQTDIESGVARGTQRGNESQNDLLRQLVNYTAQLVRKEWTVKYTPSSAAGRVNQMSSDAYDRVTGMG